MFRGRGDGGPWLATPMWGPMQGPRCDSTDPECWPMPGPHQVMVGYRPGRPRVLFRDPPHRWLPRDAGEECHHDGECIATSTECLPWIYRSGTYGGLGLDVTFFHRVWCGCVEARCQWFEQDREDGGVQLAVP